MVTILLYRHITLEHFSLCFLSYFDAIHIIYSFHKRKVRFSIKAPDRSVCVYVFAHYNIIEKLMYLYGFRKCNAIRKYLATRIFLSRHALNGLLYFVFIKLDLCMKGLVVVVVLYIYLLNCVCKSTFRE